jgi:hypothetical protein
MRISMITIVSGAVLVGFLTINDSALPKLANPHFVTSGLVTADSDDVPGTDPVRSRMIVVTGTVVDVRLSSLIVETADVAPVNVAVPETAGITRDGKKVELSEIIPGDYARIDAVPDEDRELTARNVVVNKLR